MMLRSLVLVACLGLIGIYILDMRQRRFELYHHMTHMQQNLHEDQQAIWNQQATIAARTSPEHLHQMIAQMNLPLEPAVTVPGSRAQTPAAIAHNQPTPQPRPGTQQ